MNSNSIRKDLIVAIDGHSSCGKSTFAKDIAASLGYIFIDTGAMYRAVTLASIRAGAVANQEVNPLAVEQLLGQIDISFCFNPKRGASDIYVDGECVEEAIRGIEVSNLVSRVSALQAVRERLTLLQQDMGRKGGVVMDGRDIGTAVFPDAQIKIYMTTAVSIRAQRRYLELKAKGQSVSLEEIEANIEMRDREDESREIAPLRRAEDATLLDNGEMTPAEQMRWFMDSFKDIIYA